MTGEWHVVHPSQVIHSPLHSHPSQSKCGFHYLPVGNGVIVSSHFWVDVVQIPLEILTLNFFLKALLSETSANVNSWILKVSKGFSDWEALARAEGGQRHLPGKPSERNPKPKVIL